MFKKQNKSIKPDKLKQFIMAGNKLTISKDPDGPAFFIRAGDIELYTSTSNDLDECMQQLDEQLDEWMVEQ
jgi:hypothetical protein